MTLWYLSASSGWADSHTLMMGYRELGWTPISEDTSLRVLPDMRASMTRLERSRRSCLFASRRSRRSMERSSLLEGVLPGRAPPRKRSMYHARSARTWLLEQPALAATSRYVAPSESIRLNHCARMRLLWLRSSSLIWPRRMSTTNGSSSVPSASAVAFTSCIPSSSIVVSGVTNRADSAFVALYHFIIPYEATLGMPVRVGSSRFSTIGITHLAPAVMGGHWCAWPSPHLVDGASHQLPFKTCSILVGLMF